MDGKQILIVGGVAFVAYLIASKLFKKPGTAGAGAAMTAEQFALLGGNPYALTPKLFKKPGTAGAGAAMTAEQFALLGGNPYALTPQYNEYGGFNAILAGQLGNSYQYTFGQ